MRLFSKREIMYFKDFTKKVNQQYTSTDDKTSDKDEEYTRATNKVCKILSSK